MSEWGVGGPSCEVPHPAPESKNPNGYCNHGPNGLTSARRRGEDPLVAGFAIQGNRIGLNPGVG